MRNPDQFQKSRLLVLLALSIALLPRAGTTQSREWLILEDVEQRKIEARILEIGPEKVSFIRKVDGKRYEVALNRFSEESLDLFEKWKADEAKRAEMKAQEGFSKKLYPRTQLEIEAGLAEIAGREKPDNIDQVQHETITALNTYRFLCGVSHNVIADPALVENSTAAAKAVAKHGSLSHDIGSYTDKCNLSPLGDIRKALRQYILDPGANNREDRGHRRWCLNAAMGKTGFGSAGPKFSAMWAMDGSGTRSEESWAYPGKGFFPIERLHGGGWSLYLPARAPAAGALEVTVHKLTSRPEELFGWSDRVPGEALPVPFVRTYQNAINFEPDAKPVTQKGMYYVRVKGGEVREQYLVELY